MHEFQKMCLFFFSLLFFTFLLEYSVSCFTTLIIKNYVIKTDYFIITNKKLMVAVCNLDFWDTGELMVEFFPTPSNFLKKCLRCCYLKNFKIILVKIAENCLWHFQDECLAFMEWGCSNATRSLIRTDLKLNLEIYIY